MWGSSVAPPLPRESSPTPTGHATRHSCLSPSPPLPQLLRSSPQENQEHTRNTTKQESPPTRTLAPVVLVAGEAAPCGSRTRGLSCVRRVTRRRPFNFGRGTAGVRMSVGTLPRESSPDGYGLRDPAQLAESLSPTPPNSCVPPLKRTKSPRAKSPSRRAPPTRTRTAVLVRSGSRTQDLKRG